MSSRLGWQESIGATTKANCEFRIFEDDRKLLIHTQLEKQNSRRHMLTPKLTFMQKFSEVILGNSKTQKNLRLFSLKNSYTNILLSIQSPVHRIL